FSLEGDFRATVFPVEHLVADLDVHRDPSALLEPPRAYGDEATLGGLLLRGIGDVEPAAHRFRLVVGNDDHPVFERRDAELWPRLRCSRHRRLLQYGECDCCPKARPK